MELEKLYSNRIAALEKALEQKDEMVQDLEEQNRNMVRTVISESRTALWYVSNNFHEELQIVKKKLVSVDQITSIFSYCYRN